MGVKFTLPPPFFIYRYFKIFQEFGFQLGLFDLAGHVLVGVAKQKLKGDNIFKNGFAGKVVSIGFYGVKEPGGQFCRRLYACGPQVFCHDARGRSVSGPDIRVGACIACIGVVIDNDIGFELLEKFIMGRLGIDNDEFRKPACLDFSKQDQANAQKAQHGQVVGPFDHIGAGDGDPGHFTPEETLDRHGAGNGVRVGINSDQHLVFAGKYIVETPESFRSFHCGSLSFFSFPGILR